MGVSYLVATLMRCIVGITHNHDFQALRVAATFPNIVALPILIFPSLCEFPVVYEGYVVDAETQDSAYLQRQCVAQSTTMIFCYFFSWSFIFWSFGNRQLMQAASKRNEEIHTINEELANDIPATKDVELEDQGCGKSVETGETTYRGKDDASEERHSSEEEPIEARNENTIVTTVVTSLEEQEQQLSMMQSICSALKQTVTSAGFIAMMAAFVTACIPPLQKALFEAGEPLRFLGSALETLGIASSPISTMVVAASLVPPRPHCPEQSSEYEEQLNNIVDENPGMSDPNFGPYRRRPQRSSRFQNFRRSFRNGSMRVIQAVPRSTPEMIRLHVWFCLSRLVLTPAVIVGLILALDCNGNLLSGVPNLAKLVIIVNSALPGALIVIVLLKSKDEMAETAAAVAKVYLPSYLLSIVTIAAWTAVGLWLTLPDDDGLTVCQR